MSRRQWICKSFILIVGMALVAAMCRSLQEILWHEFGVRFSIHSWAPNKPLITRGGKIRMAGLDHYQIDVGPLRVSYSRPEGP